MRLSQACDPLERPLPGLLPLVLVSLSGLLLSGWLLGAGLAQVSLGVPLLVGSVGTHPADHQARPSARP